MFIGPGSFADFGGRGGDASRTYVGDETATGDGGDQQVPRRAAAYGVSTAATDIVRSRQLELSCTGLQLAAIDCLPVPRTREGGSWGWIGWAAPATNRVARSSCSPFCS